MQTFHTPEAARISGVPLRTVDYWARVGTLKPSVAEARGTGSERLYSLVDVMALRALGFFPDTSAQFRRKLVAAIRSAPKSNTLRVELMPGFLSVVVHVGMLRKDTEARAALHP